MRNILIIGKTGQVARAWQELLTSDAGGTVMRSVALGVDGYRGWAVGREECDLALVSSIGAKLHEICRAFGGRENLSLATGSLATGSLAAVVLAAAYTQVDKAESESEIAYAVNRDAVAEVAKFCKEMNVPLVYYSTDYVYSLGKLGSGDGDDGCFRVETDPVGPLSVYGKSKLEGERAVLAAGISHLIFRTSWVYDETGKNFLNTMLNLGATREELSVVGDQFGAPTYAHDLVWGSFVALKKMLDCGFAEQRRMSGVYHLCNAGETSWYDFALKIFALACEQFGVKLKVGSGAEAGSGGVKKILTAEYKTAARRPLNSRMSCAKFEKEFALAMPHWEDGLKRCMARKFGKR